MKPEKICAKCGRSFEYRKKWKNNWDEVRFCSDRCRGSKNQIGYTETILKLLEERGGGKTICPSECLPPEQKTDKDLMERVRESARQLANEGKIEITQKGRVVDPQNFRGPIRLRKRD